MDTQFNERTLGSGGREDFNSQKFAKEVDSIKGGQKSIQSSNKGDSIMDGLVEEKQDSIQSEIHDKPSQNLSQLSKDSVDAQKQEKQAKLRENEPSDFGLAAKANLDMLVIRDSTQRFNDSTDTLDTGHQTAKIVQASGHQQRQLSRDV